MSNPAELAAAMLSHPLAQRHAIHSLNTGDNRIHSPEDVLGERLARLGALILTEHYKPGYLISPFRNSKEPIKDIMRFAVDALEGTPYLWTEEVRTSMPDELPRHIVSPKVLVEPNTWHTFETGINLGGELEYDGRMFVDGTVDCMYIRDAVAGMTVLLIGEMTDAETDEGRPCITGGVFKYGHVWPDDYDEAAQKALHGPLAMMGFLASPFIPKHRKRASRAARRECQRYNQPIADDHVTFVVLRRATYEKNRDASETDVHWKHRWLVRGHMRAQWYPTERAHRLIWIAPHLKGPEDAPMLSHAYKVAQ